MAFCYDEFDIRSLKYRVVPKIEVLFLRVAHRSHGIMKIVRGYIIYLWILSLNEEYFTLPFDSKKRDYT